MSDRTMNKQNQTLLATLTGVMMMAGLGIEVRAQQAGSEVPDRFER
jgi:hypothetical protein